jgi:toxin ParE1/3/4
MGYRLRPQAEIDIVEALTYVVDRHPAGARRLRLELLETMRRLNDMPMMGSHRIGTAQDLRCFPLGSYLIFYRPTPDGIVVVRVLHAARNWSEAMR